MKNFIFLGAAAMLLNFSAIAFADVDSGKMTLAEFERSYGGKPSAAWSAYQVYKSSPMPTTTLDTSRMRLDQGETIQASKPSSAFFLQKQAEYRKEHPIPSGRGEYTGYTPNKTGKPGADWWAARNAANV